MISRNYNTLTFNSGGRRFSETPKPRQSIPGPQDYEGIDQFNPRGTYYSSKLSNSPGGTFGKAKRSDDGLIKSINLFNPN
jgi:hypothetical protein